MADITLPPGIGSYVTVLEPKPDQQGKMKYSTAVLIPKAREAELAPLKALVLKVASEKWGDKAAAIIAKAKYPVIKDGDKKVDDQGQVDSVYAGKWYFSARSDKKPIVYDAVKNLIYTDDEVYSGCFLRINGGVFAYDYQGNKGVSIGLNSVQVLRKGDRIDGRKTDGTEFSEWKDPTADPLE
jgi:hypothetical protein